MFVVGDGGRIMSIALGVEKQAGRQMARRWFVVKLFMFKLKLVIWRELLEWKVLISRRDVLLS